MSKDLAEEVLLGQLKRAKDKFKSLKSEEYRQLWSTEIKEIEDRLHEHRLNKFLKGVL